MSSGAHGDGSAPTEGPTPQQMAQALEHLYATQNQLWAQQWQQQQQFQQQIQMSHPGAMGTAGTPQVSVGTGTTTQGASVPPPQNIVVPQSVAMNQLPAGVPCADTGHPQMVIVPNPSQYMIGADGTPVAIQGGLPSGSAGPACAIPRSEEAVIDGTGSAGVTGGYIGIPAPSAMPYPTSTNASSGMVQMTMSQYQELQEQAKGRKSKRHGPHAEFPPPASKKGYRYYAGFGDAIRDGIHCGWDCLCDGIKGNRSSKDLGPGEVHGFASLEDACTAYWKAHPKRYTVSIYK